MDKLKSVDSDRSLYRAIAMSDEIIVVHDVEDDNYQVRVINNSDGDVSMQDYVFSSKWTVRENYSLSSYSLSHTDNRFKLEIAEFDKRVPGVGKIVEDIDGEDFMSGTVAVKEGELSEVVTKRIVCTECLGQTGDGYEIVAEDGYYLIVDPALYDSIVSAYEHGIVRFYADCETYPDPYAGKILTVEFTPEERYAISSIAEPESEGDAGESEENAGEPEAESFPPLEEPEMLDQVTLSVAEYHVEESGDMMLYVITDEQGIIYYALTESVYNDVVNAVEAGFLPDVRFGIDANGRNVVVELLT